MIDVPFIIYVILAVPLTLLGDAYRMSHGFRVDLAIIFTVALAFSGRGRLAPLFGFILGLLLDSMNFEAGYTYSIGYFLLGLLVTYIRARFLRQSLLVRCLSIIILVQLFRIYLILAGSFHAGYWVTPSFHPGIIAPGIFFSLLFFLPLTFIFDKVMPARGEGETVGEVFLR